ncbi:hypothetical protein [Mycobacterium sp. IEC1808]|uniref:hypothetical protein n=1 Tax=Mycobacterium sp. IEC1808 TaxID=1743230 RepID=UPI00114E1956|nr:hypothetical protein [Mycobacterium sp. IEC1808]
MKLRTFAWGSLAAAMSFMVLAGGTGVAHADSDPLVPAGPGIVDLIVADTPALSADPRDEGAPSADWGGAGMYCENMFVRCR